ncbi:MAG: hypothetical protein ACRDV3_06025, partial [Acidothermaceae bacterium]
MVDVEHGVAVVGMTPAGDAEFSSPPSLWISTDTVHWQDVTPPGAQKPAAPGIYPIFDTASFLNRKVGWV